MLFTWCLLILISYKTENYSHNITMMKVKFNYSMLIMVRPLFCSLKVCPHRASAAVAASPLEYIVMLGNQSQSITMYSNGDAASGTAADARCGQTLRLLYYESKYADNGKLYQGTGIRYIFDLSIRKTILSKIFNCLSLYANDRPDEKNLAFNF